MNNLLQFVIRYSAFLLFLGLESLALVLVVKYNDNQKAIYQHSSSLISGRLYQIADDVYQYNHLQSLADSLARENASLKAKVFNLERSVQRLLPADKPLDSCIVNSYHLIPAQIINNSINQRNNHFTIDRGQKDGIKSEMGVISSQGVVGIIDEVGSQYSTAISILHSAIRISAEIKRNGFFGPLIWKGVDPSRMILEAVPRQADIQIGDTIITSGYSFIFPKGIYIGKVERYWTEGGSNYYTIEVRLHEDIARMSRVYVVDYKDEAMLKNE
ncbi:MAG TPA: rod shape-determining protein MreC [Saprospiraceae bacterium]|nr:rod shape-determining protein MreC [Saprospiraceae bacterium]